jgi:hypothetical protein
MMGNFRDRGRSRHEKSRYKPECCKPHRAAGVIYRLEEEIHQTCSVLHLPRADG